MIRVFIAEDNQFARESLLQCMNWEELEYEVIGEAENGLDALEKIRREKPDLLILDIKMPGKSGLEVLREVRGSGLACECIFATGYEEFDYAREGLRLEASDFLLKPIDYAELSEALKRAAQRLRERKGTQMEERWERLLTDALYGNREAMTTLEKELKEQYRFSRYSLLTVNRERREGQEETGGDFLSAGKEILRALNQDSDTRLFMARIGSGFALLLLFQKSVPGKEYDVCAFQIADSFYREISARGYEVGIGIADHRKHIEELPAAYGQANFAYNSRFFFENTHVIHYGTVKSESIRNGYSMLRDLEHFYHDLKDRPENIVENVREIGRLIETDASYDADYAKNILAHMSLMINTTLREGNEEILQISVRDIRKSRSIREALQTLEADAQRLTEKLRGRREGDLSGQTLRILDYMREHYAEKMGLPDMSEELDISVSHICRLLKNETGETFTSILNRIRLQEAIRMLRSGQLRVYEVAEKVGYSNYAYFYQQFRKEMGCSPTEFEGEA